MVFSYLIVVLLTVVALLRGVTPRNRLTLIELLIVMLLLTAPLSLVRDVPKYKEIFESFLGIPEFPELLIRIVFATIFLGTLEVMIRIGFSIGSVITFVFLAIPTVACNQLRLSLAIFVMLIVEHRLRGIRGVLLASLIHKSIIIGLFLPQLNENRRHYIKRLIVLFALCGTVVVNLEPIMTLLLPHLGNVATYLYAKEISNIYDMNNQLNGIEFPLFFLFVSLQSRSVRPAVVVGVVFVLTRLLVGLPNVITMRFFELFCLLFLFSNLRAMKIRPIPVLAFGFILLVRFYLHYSVM